MTSEEHAIGIDLGTTYSCVAVWRHERVEIIANDQGNRTTPSCVAFSDEERLLGDAAQNQAHQNATNTVFGIKRMIGRQFKDAELQKDIKFWPFKVMNNEGNPTVQVQFMGETKTFTPEEISAMILTKMKQSAELKLGPVKKAVITVPAYFNNSQRQSTLDAGKIAGLDVLRILTEPTAAALAYGIDARTTASNLILVYDLGGGTFDVSLLKIEGNKFVVMATSGDTHLGGEDFDNILVKHCVQVFQTKHGYNISNNAKAIQRLKVNCEKAKRVLSSSTRVKVEVDSLYDGIDFSFALTRAKFESLCQEQFLSTIKCIEALLSTAEIKAAEIDEVVLSGGSSRIPRIQRLISEFFDGKPINHTIHLDEAVASGAAIQAAVLADNMKSDLNSLVLVDVTPLTLGVEVSGVKMGKVIERNTILPTQSSRDFTTMHDFQKCVLISVYEGESISSKHNLLLGQFKVENILQGKRGVPQIEVTFKIDFDGILTVTARDKATHATNNIVIVSHRGRLGKEQIQKMIQDAKALDAKDEQLRIQYHSQYHFEVQNSPSYHQHIAEKPAFFKGWWVKLSSWVGNSYDSD